MIINDEGYIVSLRRHGEKSLILTLLTKQHGKMVGYVKNCLNKKSLGIFQLGNRVTVEAYARLEENMWSFRIELAQSHAASFMVNPAKLAALSAFCSLVNDTLPEAENLDDFYRYIDNFFNFIDADNWLAHYCYFEFYLMSFLGIALDLEKCSVTGSYENLRYISPKTGKAVCEEVGAPYHNRLYAYPHFIIENNYQPTPPEIKNLLALTGFFLHKNFFKTHCLKFPENRDTLLDNLGLD